MRSFYVVGLDPSRRDLHSVKDAELAGFDTTLLSRGKWVESLPADLRLYVSGRKRAHAFGNGWGWKIFSAPALAIVRAFAPESEVQMLPLTVVNHKTGAPITGYHLVNCVRVIPALAYERGERMIYAHQVAVRDSRIPPDTHLFRLEEEPRHWIASGQLWEQLATFDGFDATHVETVLD